jgi:tetratricopeptide (TPR) repeat protein
MNNLLVIIALAVAALIILVLILKKSSGKKVTPVEKVEEEKVEIAREIEPEPISTPEEPVVEEVVEAPAEAEVVIEPEISPQEPEVIEEAPPLEPEAVTETVPAQQPAAVISLASYEQRMVALKEQRLAELTTAIENNEESRREQLQVELVALTEALSFLQQSYDKEISCRNTALKALAAMKPEMETADYEQAYSNLSEGELEEAERIFDGIVEKNDAFSAAAAYQSGCLSECRMDFSTAMARFDKAVTLDGNSPDILRSAALLARKLYLHKKALVWFSSLVELLEKQGEDTLDLALARREQAYTAALVGQHKQAGALYKQAMVSLTNLVGKDDPEMGVCWLQIGKLQEALGQYEKAEDPYSKALAIMSGDQGNMFLAEILDKLAGLYMELEREAEAVPLFERLCALKSESPHPDNASLAMAYSNLAEAYRISGKYEESEGNYKQALAITEELRGRDHAAVGSILQELAQLCERQGKKDEAKGYRDRAAAIFQRVLEEQEAAGQEAVKLNLSD